MRDVLWPLKYLTSRPRLWTVRVSTRLDTFKLNSLPIFAPFSFNMRFGDFLQRTTEFPDQKLRFPFLRVCVCVCVTSLAHRTVSEWLITSPLVNKEVLYCARVISTHKLFVCCTVSRVMFARCVLSFTQTPCDSCRVGETVERSVV